MWPWHHGPTPILLEGPWGPLLLTTLKLCLVGVCAWGPQGRKKTRQRERTTNIESVTATLESKRPPAPGGGSEGFSCPPIPYFPLPLPNISTAGQDALALRWKGSWGCLCVSLGPRESLKSLG